MTWKNPFDDVVVTANFNIDPMFADPKVGQAAKRLRDAYRAVEPAPEPDTTNVVNSPTCTKHGLYVCDECGEELLAMHAARRVNDAD